MVNKLLKSRRGLRPVAALQYGLIAALVALPLAAVVQGGSAQLKMALSNAVSNLDAS